MEGYGWFGTAYFMYDIWSMYKVHSQKLTDKLKTIKLTSHNTFNAPTTEELNANGRAATGTTGTTGTANSANSNCPSFYDHIKSEKSSKLLMMATGQLQNGQQQKTNSNRAIDEIVNTETYPRNGHLTKGKNSFFRYLLAHPVMVIHHIFVGTVGFLVVTYIRGGGHCIYSYIFMMEFSTPFVSLRGILSTLGLKETRFYLINGLLMLATFAVCRVLMWPYIIWRYSEVIQSSWWQAIWGLPSTCLICILILFVPQIYWFFLMIRGALKVFFPTMPKETATSTQMACTNGKTPQFLVNQ